MPCVSGPAAPLCLHRYDRKIMRGEQKYGLACVDDSLGSTRTTSSSSEPSTPSRTSGGMPLRLGATLPRYYIHLKRPSAMDKDMNYYLFRGTTLPAWEVRFRSVSHCVELSWRWLLDSEGQEDLWRSWQVVAGPLLRHHRWGVRRAQRSRCDARSSCKGRYD